MYKIGICGNFADGKKLLNGQTIKTKILTEELKKNIGSSSIKTIDTYAWQRNPFALFTKCLNLIKSCKNVIILTSHNGVKVLIPLFLFFNAIFHRKLHYVVIGGWLPDLLNKNYRLKNQVMKLDGIYVETKIMIKSLNDIGLNNIRYLPNFKQLNILKENELVYQIKEPYKLCTFSRIMKEKGIEDAIETIIKINNIFGKKVFTLDIYGQIEKNYVERFNRLMDNFPEYIVYKGEVNFNESVDILKNYYILLFPTHFKTEGIPGTIIDAYASGLPVIASNWDSANEIIIQNITGLIYDFSQKLQLEKLLIEILNNPKKINSMKKNCINKALLYKPEVVIDMLLKYL